MPELSKETENLKRKITENREIIASFIIISELSNKAEILKKKNCNKQKNKTNLVSNQKQNMNKESTFSNTVYNLCSNRI